jgi:hypothetical protein
LASKHILTHHLMYLLVSFMFFFATSLYNFHQVSSLLFFVVFPIPRTVSGTQQALHKYFVY